MYRKELIAHFRATFLYEFIKILALPPVGYQFSAPRANRETVASIIGKIRHAPALASSTTSLHTIKLTSLALAPAPAREIPRYEKIFHDAARRCWRSRRRTGRKLTARTPCSDLIYFCDHTPRRCRRRHAIARVERTLIEYRRLAFTIRAFGFAKRAPSHTPRCLHNTATLHVAAYY